MPFLATGNLVFLSFRLIKVGELSDYLIRGGVKYSFLKAGGGK